MTPDSEVGEPNRSDSELALDTLEGDMITSCSLHREVQMLKEDADVSVGFTRTKRTSTWQQVVTASFAPQDRGACVSYGMRHLNKCAH